MSRIIIDVGRVDNTSKSRRTVVNDTLDFAEVDALSLAIFGDKQLTRTIRTAGKLDLATVRANTERALARHRSSVPSIRARNVLMHDHLMAGFSGEAVIISSALLLNTLAEAEKSFRMSFKTIKSKLGHPLDPAPSELALRMLRAVLAAARVFGNVEAARKYLRTRNFALGGATPVDLLQTAEGERIVLNELQTQADGGPL